MKAGVIRCLAALMAGVLAVGLVSCEKTEKKRRTVGYKGEARGNAFLAAQRLLERRGRDVRFERGMGGLDYGTSVLFLTPATINTVGRAKRVSRWVNGGGHLVVMFSHGEKRGNDFSMWRGYRGSDREDAAPGVQYLLDELGVELVERSGGAWERAASELDRDEWEAMAEEDRALLDAEKSKFTLGGKPMEVFHWAETSLRYDVRYAGEYGTGASPGMAKHRYLSLPRGSGRVTLLTDASPLRNRYIGYGDHARLLTELVEMSGTSGAVVFLDGGGDNFFTMVWRYFWMAVVGLVVLVALWLWKNLPRFGPPQDLPEGEAREFSAQVRGVGRFLWRHKRDDALLASMRQSVQRKLSTGPGGEHEGIFELLAGRTGLPVESVIEAMTRNNVREPGVMVRVVKNLQTILKSINN